MFQGYLGKAGHPYIVFYSLPVWILFQMEWSCGQERKYSSTLSGENYPCIMYNCNPLSKRPTLDFFVRDLCNQPCTTIVALLLISIIVLVAMVLIKVIGALINTIITMQRQPRQILRAPRIRSQIRRHPHIRHIPIKIAVLE